MPWVRIAEEFAEHPKLMKVGPLGMAMQVAALCYCNRHLTDGFLPAAKVPTLLNLDGLGNWRDVAEALVEHGIWEPVEGGYRVHDYLDYQPSREQVLAEREAAKKRMANIRGRSEDVREKFERTSEEVREKFNDPVPVPVPNRDINPSPSETGTQSVPAAKGPSIEEVNGQKLIAELVAEYRTIEGVEPKNGDYPFLGALYNEYGYDRVLCALNRLRQAMAVQPLQKPLVYLKGILKREGEESASAQRYPPQAQPAKRGKYAGIYVTHAGNGGGPDGGRGPPV